MKIRDFVEKSDVVDSEGLAKEIYDRAKVLVEEAARKLCKEYNLQYPIVLFGLSEVAEDMSNEFEIVEEEDDLN